MAELIYTEKSVPKIYGENIEALPQDLYIPPDALEVYLDSFEGPLDLLIYLIRKNNIDILDIPMANLTLQYINYVEKMKVIKLELAADYLLMSAMLIEIKSRMLLPKPSLEDEEDDPRAELVKKLIEYELMKDAAENLKEMPQVGQDILIAQSYFERVTESELSVREHMTIILRKLNEKSLLEFSTFFNSEKDPIPKLVVCFLAILELTKEGLIKINQQTSSPSIFLQLGEA